MLKALQVSLGGIRDVLLGSNQQHFVQHYASADRSLRKAGAHTHSF